MTLIRNRETCRRAPNWRRPEVEEHHRPRTPIYLIAIILVLLWAISTVWLLRPAAASDLVIAINGDTLVMGDEHIRIIGRDAPETYQAR